MSGAGFQFKVEGYSFFCHSLNVIHRKCTVVTLDQFGAQMPRSEMIVRKGVIFLMHFLFSKKDSFVAEAIEVWRPPSSVRDNQEMV